MSLFSWWCLNCAKYIYREILWVIICETRPIIPLRVIIIFRSIKASLGKKLIKKKIKLKFYKRLHSTYNAIFKRNIFRVTNVHKNTGCSGRAKGHLTSIAIFFYYYFITNFRVHSYFHLPTGVREGQDATLLFLLPFPILQIIGQPNTPKSCRRGIEPARRGLGIPPESDALRIEPYRPK